MKNGDGSVEIRSKVEQITFGSEISFRTCSSNLSFIYCDGYIDSQLSCISVSQGEENQINFDLEKSVFKIMPFQDPSNFRYLTTVYSFLTNFEKERASLGQKSLDERKEEISDLRQKYFDELWSNISTYDKMKNTPITYNSTVFVLVHKLSMKYLSLNDEDKDNLSFHLIDYPDTGSYFMLKPCLKMQTQKTNFVYSNDQVFLCNQKRHIHQQPYLYINQSVRKGAKEYRGEETGLEVTADLEKKTTLKITLHMDLEVVEDEDTLKTGETIWLTFSERPYYIEGLLSGNAIEMTINKIAEKLNAMFIKSESLAKDRTSGNKMHDVPTTNQTGRSDEGEDIPLYEAMTELIDMFELRFKKIQSSEQKTKSTELKPEGLFKIESINPVYGERICWQTSYYRFKHVMSGLYLCINTDKKDQLFGLNRSRDNNTLFTFVPVQSTKVDQGDRYVGNDSYYLLRAPTDSWLRLPLHQLEFNKNSPREMNENLVEFGLETCTHIDTLRVNRATSMEARQKPFLLASYPILLETMIVIGDLNSQMKKYYELKNVPGAKTVQVSYARFEKVYPNTMACIKSLIDFVVNKSPNNINMAEEFGTVSASRQNMLMDLKIVKIVMILIENLFPFIDKLSVSTRYAVNQYSAKSSSLENNGQKLNKSNGVLGDSSSLSKNKTELTSKGAAQEKLEEQNLMMRADLLNVCSEFLKLVCIGNKNIQLSMSNSILPLTRTLVLSHKMEEYLEELLRNNDDLLVEYSKIKKESAIQAAGSPRNSKNAVVSQKKVEDVSMGFEFFEYIAAKLKMFPYYTQADVLLFLSKLTKTDSKSFYMNQNSIFEVIHKAAFFTNHLMQVKTKADSSIFELLVWTDQNERATLLLESFVSQYKLPQYVDFLKAQLNLFAALCENRNTITTVFFRKHFPMEVLVAYLSKDEINDEFKAILFQLLMVLYIDKNPRKILKYPITARKFKEVSNMVSSDKPYLSRKEAKDIAPHLTEREGLKANSRYLDKDPSSSTLPLIDRKRPILPAPVNQDHRELLLIGDLRTDIIDQIRKKAELMRTPEFKLPDFYNEYTLQLLKTLNKMIKFGCYEVVDKTDFEGNKGNMEHIENIIKILAYPLEFDADYHPSLFTTTTNLRFRQNDIDEKGRKRPATESKLKKGVQNAINLNAFSNSILFSALDKNQNPIFQKNYTLRKVLNMFTNKIYQAPSKSQAGQQSVYEEIKIEICQIYYYLLDIRTEYLIDNAIAFFKHRYLPTFESNLLSSVGDQNMATLMPKLNLEAGEAFEVTKIKGEEEFVNYGPLQEFRNFDQVINRSFSEILMVALYFANSSRLQQIVVEVD